MACLFFSLIVKIVLWPFWFKLLFEVFYVPRGRRYVELKLSIPMAEIISNVMTCKYNRGTNYHTLVCRTKNMLFFVYSWSWRYYYQGIFVHGGLFVNSNWGRYSGDRSEVSSLLLLANWDFFHQKCNCRHQVIIIRVLYLYRIVK